MQKQNLNPQVKYVLFDDSRRIAVEKNGDNIVIVLYGRDDAKASEELGAVSAANFAGTIASSLSSSYGLVPILAPTTDGDWLCLQPCTEHRFEPAILRVKMSQGVLAETELDRAELQQLCLDIVSAVADVPLVFGSEQKQLIWSPADQCLLFTVAVDDAPIKARHLDMDFRGWRLQEADKKAISAAIWHQFQSLVYDPDAVALAGTRLQMRSGYGSAPFTLEVGPSSLPASFVIRKGDAAALALLLDRDLNFYKEPVARDRPSFTANDVYGWPTASTSHGDETLVYYLHEELLQGPKHIDWAQSAADRRLVLRHYVDTSENTCGGDNRSISSLFFDGKPVMMCYYVFEDYGDGDCSGSYERIITDKVAYLGLIGYLNSITRFDNTSVPEIEISDPDVPLDDLCSSMAYDLESHYSPEAAALSYHPGDELIALVTGLTKDRVVDRHFRVLKADPYSKVAQYVCQLEDDHEEVAMIMEKDVLRLVSSPEATE